MKIITLAEIKRRLAIVKKMGFVKSHRKGPTGVGKTLEDLLGIKENNLKLPDFGEIELKSQRENDSSMMTLFTFNNKAWQIDQLKAIEKYGSFDAKKRKGMYYTLGTNPNSAGLFVYTDKNSVQIRHVDGEIIVKWDLNCLVEQFRNKVKNLIIVSAKVEFRDEIEYFFYDRARLLTGGTDTSILKSQFESGEILIDLRLHKKESSKNKFVSRNHGTGFRVKRNNLEKIYENIKEIKF
jgi:hypothetical protein